MVESSVLSSKKKLFAAIVPDNAILISPPSVRTHPFRLIAVEELLNNSIHSSFAEARVPAQAISLIRTDCGGYGVVTGGGVPVDVGLGVDVAVSVGLAEGETVALREAETVGVRVAGVAVPW